MTKLTEEHRVYSDFLTNLAVAWFSAGVIAPLFSPLAGIFRFAASFIAVVACLISLRLAVLLAQGGKE